MANLSIAIVGGGIGGLATAWHLAGRGIDAVVVEAGSVAAGAAATDGGAAARAEAAGDRGRAVAGGHQWPPSAEGSTVTPLGLGGVFMAR